MKERELDFKRSVEALLKEKEDLSGQMKSLQEGKFYFYYFYYLLFENLFLLISN